MSFTPSQERALKLIEEFESGPKLSDVRLKSTSRISGAFPLPSDFQNLNPLGNFFLNKRPFDDSILNQNDSLLKKRRLETRSNDDVNNSLNDSFVAASPWEMRKMKGELIQAKAEITALEARCNQLFNRKKEDLLLYEQERQAFKQTIDSNNQMIADFEAKLKKMRKREEQLKEELDGISGDKKKDLQISEEKNNSLTTENMKLKAKLSEIELKRDEINRELNTAKTGLNSALEEIKSSSERIAKLQTQLTEHKVNARQHELDKSALSMAQRKISELENEAKNFNEMALTMKDQESKLIRLSELERHLALLKAENLNLRDAPNQILKLNEVVDDLRMKLANKEEVENLQKTTKVELGLALSELNEYRAISYGIIKEGASYIELSAYLKELQQANLVAHSELARVQAKLQTSEDVNKGLLTNCNAMKIELAKFKADLEAQSNIFRRLKKQHAITTWERDDLRKMLDTLQKETTVACADSKTEALERLVEGYRKRVDQMEQEMTGALTALSPSQVDTAATLENLRKKNAELMQKLEKAEYELEHRNLKGDFDTRNTKILHFKMNPTDEAINKREDSLEKAQNEVAVLREKIRILQEEAHNASKLVNVTQIATGNLQEIHSKEIDDLREKLKSQKIKHERVVEAFKKTSREFREAVYALLGYNVSPLCNMKQYKFTSMYADSPDHHLLFQMQPEGGMGLLETEMSNSLSDLIQEYLNHHDSIPMFLSAVTMKLFNTHSQSTIIS